MDCSYKANQEAVASDQELVIYDEQLAAKISRRQEMERLMHKALAAQEFQVWLQPKYDLATRNTLGAEALVRWDSPELGFLMPYSFMDLFERNGFAVELDYYVLERVCEIQSARLKKGLPALPISVNQSGLHITEQGYLGRMREMMDRWQLIPGLIELEITETAFIDFTTRDQREDAAQIIDDLQDIGFSLSMDDFCTGYSSLSMLQNLPMNVMKIDRSVLWDAEKSPRSMSILHHVIALGKALSMSVLVEGIETEEQEKHLLSLGCDSGQGFFYARPMPIKEFYEEFLPEHS
jgi:EAL domain-containing protein (putative c-di-GMP-specific phosphodiesterase class I)